MTLETAAAWFALGKLTSDDAIAAADHALGRGLYSYSLGLVPFEQPVWSNVEPLFLRALSELNIPVPPPRDASLTLAREYARQIVAGEISPYQGASQIWWELTYEEGADPSLRVFMALAISCDDDPDGRLVFEAEIVEEAQRLLREA